MKARQFWISATVVTMMAASGQLNAQTPVSTAFTYQGQLTQVGVPVDDSADLVFTLWDAEEGGSQVSNTINVDGYQVTNGLVTVVLDFCCDLYAGDTRWLQIEVRSPAGSGEYTTLSPRQELTPTPYAAALPGLWIQQNVTSPNLIGGWNGNTIASGVVGATIGGGGTPEDLDGDGSPDPNRVMADYCTVGGGAGNLAGGERGGVTGVGATASGGVGHTASGAYSTVAGGWSNRATGDYSTVAGGALNAATDEYTTVGGGKDNWSTKPYATITGGDNNYANAPHGTIGGGEDNYVHGGAVHGTIGGGWDNEVGHYNATVAGGRENVAGGDTAAIGGGFRNEAGGLWATVPGGAYNDADGECSFAAGNHAWAEHDGAFVWADNTGGILASEGNNQFIARASGGTWFYSNAGATAGVVLAPGANYWDERSDRNAKTNFQPIDPRDVLTHLASIPLSTWNYKSQDPSIRHIGPMAQDFHAAFGVGTDERHISSIDTGGVAMAAIQGIYQIVQEKENEIAAMKEQNEKLTARLAAIEALVADLADAGNGGAR